MALLEITMWALIAAMYVLSLFTWLWLNGEPFWPFYRGRKEAKNDEHPGPPGDACEICGRAKVRGYKVSKR